MKLNYSIYRILHPITNLVVYVGKTSNTLKDRLNSHIWAARNRKKKNLFQAWIISLDKQKLIPKVELIELASESDVNIKERYWISYYRDINPSLKNTLPGGDGNPKGFQFKNRYVPPKGVLPDHFKKFLGHQKGKKRSEQSKLKMSAVQKNSVRPHLYKSVISKNIITGKTQEFKSVKLAAAHYNITPTQIVQRCKKRRMAPINNLLFKYSNDTSEFKLTRKQGIDRKVQLKSESELVFFNTIRECAKSFKIKRDTVYAWCNKNKHKRGYVWSFYDEIEQ